MLANQLSCITSSEEAQSFINDFSNSLKGRNHDSDRIIIINNFLTLDPSLPNLKLDKGQANSCSNCSLFQVNLTEATLEESNQIFLAFVAAPFSLDRIGKFLKHINVTSIEKVIQKINTIS